MFWPGEFRGLYSPWGHKESDTLSNFHVKGHYDGRPQTNIIYAEKRSLKFKKSHLEYLKSV